MQSFSSRFLLWKMIRIEKIANLKAILQNSCRWFLANAACFEFAIIIEGIGFLTIMIATCLQLIFIPQGSLQKSFLYLLIKMSVCGIIYSLARKIECKVVQCNCIIQQHYLMVRQSAKCNLHNAIRKMQFHNAIWKTQPVQCKPHNTILPRMRS